MTKRTQGAKSPMNNLRYLFTIAAVLLLAAVLIAPAAADATVSTVDELENAVKTGGTITLGSDIVLTKPLTIEDGQEITIIGDGNTITRGVSGFLFTVTNGKLTLGDGTSTLIIHGNDTSYRATNTGDMQNTKSLILLSGAKANLVMNDKVTLRNNSISDISQSASWYPSTSGNERIGGAVQAIHGAQFTMNGGEIIYNDACAGGGVWTRLVGDGDTQTRFIMNNGKISYNNAKASANADAGGVFVGNRNSAYETDSKYDVIFEMYGGEISYNSAINVGGGIKNQGTVKIFGGKIIGNEAAEGAAIASCGSTTNNLQYPTLILSGGMVEGNIVVPATTNTENCGGVISVQASTVELSGTFTLADDQELMLNYFKSDEQTGILVTGEFTGTIQLALFDGRGPKFSAEQLIFTIANNVNQNAEDLINRLVLVDQTTWTLSAKGDKQIVLAYNTPKAIIGEPYANIEWINSTIANVTITLDPKANDATKVSVYVNETGDGLGTPVIKTGTFSKGSSISDLQFTDINPTKTYSVVAVLENENVKNDWAQVITHTDVVLQNQKPPMPDTVKITGAGGAEIPATGIVIQKDGKVTFDVSVLSNNKPLKDEFVTWTIVDSSNDNITFDDDSVTDKTATSVTIKGVIEGTTTTLTATSVKNTSAINSITITIPATSSTTPSYAIELSDTQIVRGIEEEAQLSVTLKDGSGNVYFGQGITWKIEPATGVTTNGGDTSGSTATFKATVPGTYTVTANLTSDNTVTATATLIYIGNPSIDIQPIGETYTQTEQATALSITASVPAQGTGSLSYKWFSSTDKNFGVDVTEITGATEATYKPSTETVGTMYYRVEVSYTQDGYPTKINSDAVAIVVVEPTADVITLSPAGTAYTLYVGGNDQTIVATAKNTSVNKDVQGIIWSKASGDAVKITPNGNTVVITPVSEGTAVITASVGNKEQKVTITVKPASDAPKDTGGSSSSSGSSVWLTETPTQTPTPTPTETAQPTDTVPTDIPSTQPTATPETPGFGVLAVLAGLGAVAVLRRR